MSCDNIYLIIVYLLFPFIFVYNIQSKTQRYEKARKACRLTREWDAEIKKITDKFPARIRKKLAENTIILKSDKEEFMAAYCRYFRAYVYYLIYGLAYLGLIIERLIYLIKNLSNQNQEWALKAQLSMMAIILFIVIVYYPIKDFFRKKTIDWSTEDFTDAIDSGKKFAIDPLIDITFMAIEMFVALMGVVFEIGVTIFLNNHFQLEMTFTNCLILLLIYQYGILRIITKVFALVIKYKLKIFRFLLEGNKLFRYLKNATYIALVMLYSASVDAKISDYAIYEAMAIVFLIDTYISERRSILKED